jgi:hypothetical protein
MLRGFFGRFAAMDCLLRRNEECGMRNENPVALEIRADLAGEVLDSGRSCVLDDVLHGKI